LVTSSDGALVSLTASVNGMQVSTASDSDGYGDFNRVGLYSAADHAGAKILFDNVVATSS
jgi:hypothetical protein